MLIIEDKIYKIEYTYFNHYIYKYIIITNKRDREEISHSQIMNNMFTYYGPELETPELLSNTDYFILVNKQHSWYQLTMLTTLLIL